ncbi:MAG: acyltransferase [Lachnospiraceae bacterium]|nr:acyltransferase [Lachnospiraceae bacterium]
MIVNIKKLKRLWMMFRLTISSDGLKKAKIVKKSNMFKAYGENNYWFPRILPAEPHLVKIHNNVHVATDVYFCTHDVMQRMFNNVPEYYDLLSEKDKASGGFKYNKGEIEIYDNVFIGAKSIIMYDVKIGPNAIVAAGSVVTKDVPEGMVVGGNPARVISTVADVAKKRADKLRDADT